MDTQKSPTLLEKWQIFKAQRPLAVKLTLLGALAGVLLVGLVGAGIAGYFTYNYTQHDPKFCISCHATMIESYKSWEISEHKDVSCHTCHPLTTEVILNYTYRIMMGMPNTIPPREEGEILVLSSDCMKCHWGKDEEFPDANKVAASAFHAQHFFKSKVECMTCHGDQQVHVFAADPAQCLNCHKNQTDQLHGTTVQLACLNCHTDQTVDVRPTREKCLACHSDDDAARQMLASAATIDVKYHPLAPAALAEASKIHSSADAAMRTLNCADCHAAHPKEPQAASATCLSCHVQVMTEGQHPRHVPYYQGNCQACHAPHEWNIDPAWAQQECAKCHPYQSPGLFIQAQKAE